MQVYAKGYLPSQSKNKFGKNLLQATLNNSAGMASISGDLPFFKFITEARISEAVIGSSSISSIIIVAFSSKSYSVSDSIFGLKGFEK